MSKKDFETWLNTFRKSINGYNYYVDFPKVYANAEKYKKEIYLLNSLIGNKDIENEFVNLINEYPKCLNVIPILLAVRNSEIYCQDEKGAINYCFNDKKQSVDDYVYFMHKTGLFDLMASSKITVLYDYVVGVETGLDSNGRKNRGGHQMEDLVESFIKKCNVIYHKELVTSKIKEMYNLDLSSISFDGKVTKRFDFVVKTNNCVYGIETNFYTSSGSKLNETARSYKMIATEAKNITSFKFVWITDGAGWISARSNLEETFNSLDTMYNIKDLENGCLDKLFC